VLVLAIQIHAGTTAVAMAELDPTDFPPLLSSSAPTKYNTTVDTSNVT
jgi:hypothetical protein